jgi:hypothetical protein
MHLEVLGQRIHIEFPGRQLGQLLSANFGSMTVGDRGERPHLHYRTEHTRPVPAEVSGVGLRAQGGRGDEHDDETLFLLEADITIDLQKRRPDLFFLHAAALEWKGTACLLAGESGIGKSTTAWALLHHGFGYLSDELSPIDLELLTVASYPRALCLKAPPEPPYVLPAGVIRGSRTIRVPCSSLPAAVIDDALPVKAIVLLGRREAHGEPRLRALDTAEAAVRLYGVALNALAHPGCGLDAAVRIAEKVPCYALVANGELSESCKLIMRQLW